ncbi:MAG: T9SS type A sorting domain-containing protein [Ignavibacteriaceae bacterium]|nr:T9SS type A sorting domain-containing protein [Ignavibacteriaceae bacterium]
MYRCTQFLAIVIFFLFNSVNIYAQWVQIKELNNSDVQVITVKDSLMFAGTYGNGIFKSSDNGKSWSAVNNGLTDLYINAIIVKDSLVFAAANSRIYRSGDNGAYWAFADSGIYGGGPYQSLTVQGKDIFVGLMGELGGIFRSTDNGVYWNSTNWAIHAQSLFSSGKNLFVSDYGGGEVLLSTNNGSTWNNVGISIKSSVIYNFAMKDSTIYIAASGAGVYFTIDNGINWTQINTGLTNIKVRAIAVNDSLLIAGTEGGGIFYSGNNGVNWTAINTGLTNYNINTIIINNGNIYAGTNGSGVWRRPLSEMVTDVKGLNSTKPNEYSLSQNYPNPFNPSTQIEFTIKKEGLATLRIYNVLGQEVATILNSVIVAGSHIVSWNASGLPSGVYFYSLTVNGYTETKKMLLLK